MAPFLSIYIISWAQVCVRTKNAESKYRTAVYKINNAFELNAELITNYFGSLFIYLPVQNPTNLLILSDGIKLNGQIEPIHSFNIQHAALKIQNLILTHLCVNNTIYNT